MPAVTVDDLTVLDRLKTPGLGDTVRPVKQLIDAPSGYEGEGFPVRRAFAGVDLRDLDPFVHMDQMGEVEYAPGEPKGTPWHPHRGFETVTYIIDGVFDHQDSHGGGGTITNGDTQWMTAGVRAAAHRDAAGVAGAASGGLFHGIQLWVNLPARRQVEPARLPGHPQRPGRSGHLRRRRRAGAGHRRRGRGDEGPGSTYTPMTMVHATVAAGRAPRPAVERGVQRARLRALRAGHRGRRGRPVRTGNLAVLGAGDFVTVHAVRQPGQPYAGPRRARPRRPADPRAGRLGRAVRDEHQGRGDDRRSRTSRRAGSAPSRPRCPTCTERRPPRSAPRTDGVPPRRRAGARVRQALLDA